MFLPTVRAVSRVGKTHTALRSPSLELRSPQASTIPCFIQDYATDRPTWLTYPHTQYSLSFKEREREKRREEKKVEAMAMAEGMQAGGRAEQKVDIIAGLDLLGKCLRRPREERRGDRGGTGWQMGGGPKYLQCSRRRRFTASRETEVVRPPCAASTANVTVTAIGGNLL